MQTLLTDSQQDHDKLLLVITTQLRTKFDELYSLSAQILEIILGSTTMQKELHTEKILNACLLLSLK